MLQKSKTKSFTPVFLILLIINLSVIALLFLTNSFVGVDYFSDYISLPLYTIIPGILVILAIAAYIQSENIQEISKHSLLLLVFSFIGSLAAETTWNLYEHVLNIDPYPSIADFFYLSAPVLMFFSLVLFLKSVRDQIPKKNVILGCIISFIFLTPSIIIIFNTSGDSDPIESMVALLYPIVDSILLVPAIVAIIFSVKTTKNFFWLMILLGIIIILAADTGFLFLVTGDNYFDGHPIDILWISSYTIWAYMMFYILYNSKIQKPSEDTKNVSKEHKIEKLQKFGVLIPVLVINISIVVILITINALQEGTNKDQVLAYFSWMLIMIVIIFSSIVIILNSKLNKTLEHRTIELEETTNELIKAERFSAIGELAARLAHDLRNPLGVIVTSNELIKRQSDDENVSKYSVLIDRSLNRMQHQIDKVMDFVRVKPIEPKKTSLEKLIEMSLENIEIPKHVTIDKPKENPEINCDNQQLAVALNNIILNAIQKFSDKGEISITYEDNNENHIIKIQDSGDPIPEEDIEKIFEPLFTTKHQGTGLGLTSCKRIVEEHGGQLFASNDPTTFTIIIPKDMK